MKGCTQSLFLSEPMMKNLREGGKKGRVEMFSLELGVWEASSSTR